ncbi:hypothetical protein GHT06_018115 [Daphnia sinensis]|uniref:Uncharacterized protein n=1 Tax=Daphnia sinensis TaxID=1820382 RepID=A0AAD5PUE0_9CRUS|nr:hypothetical protein GHT06_018115 [Daphnia sinensis]
MVGCCVAALELIKHQSPFFWLLSHFELKTKTFPLQFSSLTYYFFTFSFPNFVFLESHEGAFLQLGKVLQCFQILRPPFFLEEKKRDRDTPVLLMFFPLCLKMGWVVYTFLWSARVLVWVGQLPNPREYSRTLQGRSFFLSILTERLILPVHLVSLIGNLIGCWYLDASNKGCFKWLNSRRVLRGMEPDKKLRFHAQSNVTDRFPSSTCTHTRRSPKRWGCWLLSLLRTLDHVPPGLFLQFSAVKRTAFGDR